VDPVDPEHAVEHGLFAPRQAREAGYSKRDIALRTRRGEWLVPERGLLRMADRPDQEGDALLGAVLRAGPSAVASHLSAAAVWGWGLLDDPDQPTVTIPRDKSRTSAAGMRIFRHTLSPDEIGRVGVLPLTCAARTAVDIAVDVPQVAAVVAVDSALRSGQVTLAELRLELRRRLGMRRYAAAAAVLDLADPTSGSVWESMARLLFAAAGLTEPVPQFEVVVDGVVVARVDFAWPQARLVVEIDGFTWHSSKEALGNDHTRQNRLELDGWTVLRYTPDQVQGEPARIANEVRQALEGRAVSR
jgi:hypothetical protein